MYCMLDCFISCAWHLRNSSHWGSSDGQSVWLQIGENDIIMLSDMVNTGWRWPSYCPWPHTHRNMTLQTQSVHADLLFSLSLPLCLRVCYGFHTNHFLLSVVQSDTFQCPVGLSPTCSALWTTLLTNADRLRFSYSPKSEDKSLFWKLILLEMQFFVSFFSRNKVYYFYLLHLPL